MTHRRHDDPEEFDPGQVRQNGAPWWSKSAWTLGPLAIGFLMMLVTLLGWWPIPKRNGPDHAAQGQTIHQKLDAHMEQSAQVLRVLRTMCRHAAKSDAAKEDCDR